MKKKKTIAFITPFTFRGLGWQLYCGIIDACQKLKINFVSIIGDKLKISDEKKATGNIIYELVDKESFDGVISWTSTLASSHLSESYINLFFNKNFKNLPVVSIGEKIKNALFVTVDDNKATEELIKHLIIDHGYRKIGFIRGPDQTHSASRRRFEKYKELLQKYNIKYDDNLVIGPFPFEAEDAYKMRDIFFKKRALIPKKDIEVIVTLSDLIAVELIKALDQIGIKIPEEVAVTGYNNQITSLAVEPAITTVDIHYYTVGYKAVEFLSSLIDGEKVDDYFMEAELILRNSCGCKIFTTEKSALKDINISDNFSQRKEAIERLNRVKKELSIIDNNWAIKFYDYFLEAIDTNCDKFIKYLESFIFEIKETSFDIYAFQNIITELRNIFLPYAISINKVIEMEEFLHYARILVNRAENYRLYKEKDDMIRLSETLNLIKTNFVTNFDFKSILQSLAPILKRIEVKKCFIYLYKDQENPKKDIELIYVYDNGESFLVNNKLYKSNQIIPYDYIDNNSLFSLSAKPLYFKDIQFGFIVIDCNKFNINAYDALTTQLSASIYGAKLALEKDSITDKLKKSEEKFRNIVETSPNWVWIIDNNFKYTYSSLKVFNILGYYPLEVIGKELFDLLIDEEKAKVKEIFITSLKNKKSYIELESKFKNKKGDILILSCFATAIYDNEKNIIGYQGICMDVTEQRVLENERELILDSLKEQNIELERKINERTKELKKLNNELEIALKEVEAANEAKTKFLAKITHDVKTPINCIIGFSEIIKENTIDNKYPDLIIDEAERLLLLVNQLLELSKIESGNIVLDITSFDLFQLIESIKSSFFVLSSKKGLKFSVSIDKNLPQKILGDKLKLYQILSNLINNSIKYTLKGSIKLDVRLLEKKSNTAYIIFTISDTGIGIPEDAKSRIFDSYYQIESNKTYNFDGVGLGAAITKELVTIMNGEIAFDSKVGKGTTFKVTIPFEIIKDVDDFNEKTQETIKKNDLIKNLKILIVDDYKPNRTILKTHLGSLGCLVYEAENGKEALDLCKSLDNIDIIFMDVLMSEMDGYQATEKIRKLKKGKDIPIIGTTAYTFSSDIEKCKECGMNDVLPKPFKKNEIINILNKWSNINLQENKKKYKNNSKNKKSTIDFDFFFNEYDNNKDFVFELLDDFITKANAMILIIKSSIENNDYEQIWKTAHKLKGISANLTIKNIANITQLLEKKGKESDTDMNSYKKIIKKLEKSLELVNKEIASIKNKS